MIISAMVNSSDQGKKFERKCLFVILQWISREVYPTASDTNRRTRQDANKWKWSRPQNSFFSFFAPQTPLYPTGKESKKKYQRKPVNG